MLNYKHLPVTLRSRKMKLFLDLLFVLSLLRIGECRTASSEVDIVSAVTTVEKREPLRLACTFRTLKSTEPYPSVVVKWHNQVQRFTWKANGDVTFEKDYKHEVVSHGYPTSGGLSGSAQTTTPSDPFANAPVAPDEYTWEDLVTWFQNSCSRPY